MRTELRQSDNYALFILSRLKRRKGYATGKALHRQMVALRMVEPKNRAATMNAIAKLYRNGAIKRIVCHSSDGRYAYAAK